MFLASYKVAWEKKTFLESRLMQKWSLFAYMLQTYMLQFLNHWFLGDLGGNFRWFFGYLCGLIWFEGVYFSSRHDTYCNKIHKTYGTARVNYWRLHCLTPSVESIYLSFFLHKNFVMLSQPLEDMPLFINNKHVFIFKFLQKILRKNANLKTLGTNIIPFNCGFL